jgi:hypothetical protein
MSSSSLLPKTCCLLHYPELCQSPHAPMLAFLLSCRLCRKPQCLVQLTPASPPVASRMPPCGSSSLIVAATPILVTHSGHTLWSHTHLNLRHHQHRWPVCKLGHKLIYVQVRCADLGPRAVPAHHLLACCKQNEAIVAAKQPVRRQGGKGSAAAPMLALYLLGTVALLPPLPLLRTASCRLQGGACVAHIWSAPLDAPLTFLNIRYICSR